MRYVKLSTLGCGCWSNLYDIWISVCVCPTYRVHLLGSRNRKKGLPGQTFHRETNAQVHIVDDYHPSLFTAEMQGLQSTPMHGICGLWKGIPLRGDWLSPKGTNKTSININKGVRQGDTISPKLFAACLEHIFRNIDGDTKGLNIDGERLCRLKFADEVILIETNIKDTEEMWPQNIQIED